MAWLTNPGRENRISDSPGSKTLTENPSAYVIISLIIDTFFRTI